MTLWGESINGANQKLYPMPTDEDDDDHDEDEEESKPISAVVGTTSISVGSTTTLPLKPTDHVDRPVNNKPEATTTASGDVSGVTSSTTPGTTSTATAISDTTPTPSPTFLLPSIFPTFGVSPRTQIWIYGAIGAILIFCIALGIFFCVLRRRRARINRADYEFEMVNDEDAEGAGEPLSGDGVRRKRRAGELYDAFAGESDEEIFSEGEEDHQYRDEPDEKRRARGESPGQEYSEKHN